MHTTEYKILSSYQQDALTAEMNEHSSNGWEAISLSVTHHVSQNVFYVLMKKNPSLIVPEILTVEALHDTGGSVQDKIL